MYTAPESWCCHPDVFNPICVLVRWLAREVYLLPTPKTFSIKKKVNKKMKSHKLLTNWLTMYGLTSSRETWKQWTSLGFLFINISRETPAAGMDFYGGFNNKVATSKGE